MTVTKFEQHLLVLLKSFDIDCTVQQLHAMPIDFVQEFVNGITNTNVDQSMYPYSIEVVGGNSKLHDNHCIFKVQDGKKSWYFKGVSTYNHKYISTVYSSVKPKKKTVRHKYTEYV